MARQPPQNDLLSSLLADGSLDPANLFGGAEFAPERNTHARTWPELAGAYDAMATFADGGEIEAEQGKVYPLAGAELSWQDWLTHYAAEQITRKLSPEHTRAWEWAEAIRDSERPPACFAIWPREAGKSTTIELIVSRCAVTVTRTFALYVCADQSAANGHLSDVKDMLEELGYQGVGLERATNVYGFSKGYTQAILTTANGFTLKAVGLNGNVRGLKRGTRPGLIIFDDIDDENDSADVVTKKVATIRHAILPAGTPNCAVFFGQNLIHSGGVLTQIINNEEEMLLDRVGDTPVPAIAGLQYEPLIDDSGKKKYAITGGESLWLGKSIVEWETALNAFGPIGFLREFQHDVGAGGKFFTAYSERTHVVDPFPIPDWWETWAGHDYGTTAPCASEFFVADGAGGVFVIGELYQAGLTSPEQVEAFLNVLEGLPVEAGGKPFAWPVNPMQRDGLWKTRLNLIAFDFANTFPPKDIKQRRGEYPVEVWWRRGLPAVEAVKNREANWANLRRWLTETYIDPRTGAIEPRLRFFRGACPWLLRGLERAMCDPKKPEDIDVGAPYRHPLDGTSYAMATRPFASKQDDKPKKSDAQQVLDDMPLKMRRAMTPMILGGEVRGGVTRI